MARHGKVRQLLFFGLLAGSAAVRTSEISGELELELNPPCTVNMRAERLMPKDFSAVVTKGEQKWVEVSHGRYEKKKVGGVSKVCIRQSGEGHKGGVLFAELDGKVIVVKAAVTAADAVAMTLGKHFDIPMPKFAFHKLDSDVIKAFKELASSRDNWETEYNEDWHTLAEEGFVLLMEMIDGGSYASLGKIAKDCMLKTTKFGREYQTNTSLCGLGENDPYRIAKQKYALALSDDNLKRLGKIAALDMVLMEWDQMTSVAVVPIDPPKIGNLENIMYKNTKEGGVKAVAIDFAVASWGSAQCVYEEECGAGTPLDDKIGEGFINSFLSAAPVAPNYRNRMQTLLRYPAMSTTDYKAAEFKDVYRFFPMADPLSDDQYGVFAKTVVDMVHTQLATHEAQEAVDELVGEIPANKEKVGKLTKFVKDRMEAIRTAVIRNAWVPQTPLRPSHYYDRKRLKGGWRFDKLVWASKGKVRGEGQANDAVNLVMTQSRAADNLDAKAANLFADMNAAMKYRKWTCRPNILHGGKVYPTRGGSTLKNRVQGCSEDGKTLSQMCPEEKYGKEADLPSGACSKPVTCKDEELQDDTHWCYSAGKFYNSAAEKTNTWAQDLHGYSVLIDLKQMAARVSDRTTMDPNGEVCPLDGEWHDRLFSTYEFAQKIDATVAMNANYFLNAQNVHDKTCARPYGLCMHEGVVQHRPGELGFEDPNDEVRQNHGLNPKGRVAVLFNNKDGKVKAMESLKFPKDKVTGNRTATTGDFKEGVAGNWLVKDGIALSQLELNPVPVDKEARSAIGWVEDDNGEASRVLLVVVEKKAFKEGRRLNPDPALPDGMTQVESGGISLVELADLMVMLGVKTAVNLDGGGSSNMCAKMGGEDIKCSVPSDYHIYRKGTEGIEDGKEAVYKFRSSPCQLGFVGREGH